MVKQSFDIALVEKKVCGFFGICIEGVYDRNKERRHAEARHYLWLILHDHYGMSNREIADRYGRSRRKVIKFISELRFRTIHQKMDSELYEEIKKII